MFIISNWNWTLWYAPCELKFAQQPKKPTMQLNQFLHNVASKAKISELRVLSIVCRQNWSKQQKLHSITRRAPRADGVNISIKRRSYDKFVRVILIIIKLIPCEVTFSVFNLAKDFQTLRNLKTCWPRSLFGIHLGFHLRAW